MKSLIVLSLMFATHISMAADADKEPITWMVPSVQTLVARGDSSFSIFKVEVDVRRTGFKCYHKKDGGLTVHKMIGDKVVPIKISGLKDGVIAAIVSLNGSEVCPDQFCASKTAQKSEWAPFENQLSLTDLTMLNSFNEIRGICSFPVSNVVAEFALQHHVIAKELDAKGNAQLDVKIVYFKKGSLEQTVLGTAILDLSQLKNNRDQINATIFKSNSGTLGLVQSRPGLN